MKVIEGQLTTNNEKFCIVISRFNEFIGSKLLSGAIDELKRHGVNEENIDVVWTPGAFEIPLVAKRCAKSGKYNAELSKGIAQVGLETEVPVLFGVLTTENIEQAIERAGTKAGNKGSDAAKAAIEMANLLKEI